MHSNKCNSVLLKFSEGCLQSAMLFSFELFLLKLLKVTMLSRTSINCRAASILQCLQNFFNLIIIHLPIDKLCIFVFIIVFFSAHIHIFLLIQIHVKFIYMSILFTFNFISISAIISIHTFTNVHAPVCISVCT